MYSRLHHTFSLIRFKVCGFMLRALNHLKLGFVPGDKYESIFLPADILFDEHNFVEDEASLLKFRCPL